MYEKIMGAAQIVAQEIEELHIRTLSLETQLNNERLKKEQLKQDLFTVLDAYFRED